MKKAFLTVIFAVSLLNAAPSVLINEVSRSGVVWVELHNISSQPVDLRGWKLRNSQGEDVLAGVIKPNSYLVVCESKSQLLENYPSIHSSILEVNDGTIGGGLHITNDMLELVAADGRIVDAVNWGVPQRSWRFYDRHLWNPGVMTGSPIIARIPNAFDRDVPEDFRGVSTGTPGEMNQIYNGLNTVSWGKIKAIFAGQKRR